MTLVKGVGYTADLNEAIKHARSRIVELGIYSATLYGVDHVITRESPYSEYALALIEDTMLSLGAPEDVRVDLDGDPYRDDNIGPWKVSYCCFAYAKGSEYGAICRACHYPTEHFDARANLPTIMTDRFGRGKP